MGYLQNQNKKLNFSFQKLSGVPTSAPKSSSYFFEICVPYNGHFVGELKRGIPWHAREWLADAKTWVIHVHYRDFVCGLLEHYFGVVPIVARSSEGLERLVVLP
ncbi:unnamed protein product [marine sediment metagenome]|uniref:Uncharacterized protein n=1 Tax=marine sediment metagenome TaxID=412755 RepID=X1JKE4_9ZZZZ